MSLQVREPQLTGPDLASLIEERSARVGIIGLGYVGLPLAVAAGTAGFGVTGLDTDVARVEGLRAGQSCVLDVADRDVQVLVSQGRLIPTTTPAALIGVDVFVICVPTPLHNDAPDLSYLQAAAGAIAEALRPGTLVILESTTYPGTTEELLRGILELSGLEAGRDFSLGFSPERIDPGNAEFGLADVPKIVGGIDERSTELMAAFYGGFVHRVVRVSSPRAAEMAKLLENTYRHVNIALVCEMALLCRDLGVDVWEVIDAAASKPFGFQRFSPGPGWGGHCIPVDPAYLSWRVRQMGETARFIELARETNHRMRAHVVQRVAEYLNEAGRSVKGASILVLGVTYKADVADVRESPAMEIMARLIRAGAHVRYHDPYVPTVSVEASVLRSVELSDWTIAESDILLVLTGHSSYEWETIRAKARLVFDTRNVVGGGAERL